MGRKGKRLGARGSAVTPSRVPRMLSQPLAADPGRANRAYLRRRGIRRAIPEQHDQMADLEQRGSPRGRRRCGGVRDQPPRAPSCGGHQARQALRPLQGDRAGRGHQRVVRPKPLWKEVIPVITDPRRLIRFAAEGLPNSMRRSELHVTRACVRWRRDDLDDGNEHPTGRYGKTHECVPGAFTGLCLDPFITGPVGAHRGPVRRAAPPEDVDTHLDARLAGRLSMNGDLGKPCPPTCLALQPVLPLHSPYPRDVTRNCEPHEDFRSRR